MLCGSQGEEFSSKGICLQFCQAFVSLCADGLIPRLESVHSVSVFKKNIEYVEGSTYISILSAIDCVILQLLWLRPELKVKGTVFHKWINDFMVSPLSKRKMGFLAELGEPRKLVLSLEHDGEPATKSERLSKRLRAKKYALWYLPMGMFREVNFSCPAVCLHVMLFPIPQHACLFVHTSMRVCVSL